MLLAPLLQIAAPPPTPDFVIVAVCSGGVAGRSEKAELASALARALSSQFDRAKFDSVTCSITRTGAATHNVQFVSRAPQSSGVDPQRLRDVRAVLGLILAAADVLRSSR